MPLPEVDKKGQVVIESRFLRGAQRAYVRPLVPDSFFIVTDVVNTYGVQVKPHLVCSCKHVSHGDTACPHMLAAMMTSEDSRLPPEKLESSKPDVIADESVDEALEEVSRRMEAYRASSKLEVEAACIYAALPEATPEDWSRIVAITPLNERVSTVLSCIPEALKDSAVAAYVLCSAPTEKLKERVLEQLSPAQSGEVFREMGEMDALSAVEGYEDGQLREFFAGISERDLIPAMRSDHEEVRRRARQIMLEIKERKVRADGPEEDTRRTVRTPRV